MSADDKAARNFLDDLGLPPGIIEVTIHMKVGALPTLYVKSYATDGKGHMILDNGIFALVGHWYDLTPKKEDE